MRVCTLVLFLFLCTCSYPLRYYRENLHLGSAADPITTQTETTSGYLALSISSDLSALRTADHDSDFALLMLTAEISIDGRSTAEYPIAVYDIDSKVQKTVAGIDYVRKQYVNLSSSNQPYVNLRIRYIPRSALTVYQSVYSQYESLIVGSIDIAAAANPQLVLASNIVKGVSDAVVQAAKKGEWKDELTIGIDSRQGSYYLATNGDPTVLFLVPADKSTDKSLIDINSLSLCRRDGARLCKANGDQFSEFAYLIIDAKTTDYRPISDFKVGYSCNQDSEKFQAILSQAAFTDTQRIYETKMATLIQLNDQIRRIATDYSRRDDLKKIDLLADWAFRKVNLDIPTDNFWGAHYKRNADELLKCSNEALKSALGVESIRWSALVAAFEAAKSWSNSVDAKPRNTSALRKKIVTPMEVYGLTSGYGFVYLQEAKKDIDKFEANSRAVQPAANTDNESCEGAATC